jgi:hypothetical protein
MRQLVVQAAQGALGRKRMVVLHEGIGNSNFRILLLMEGFQEKSAGVSEGLWTQLTNARERCLYPF